MNTEKQCERIGKTINEAREDRKLAQKAGWPKQNESEDAQISNIGLQVSRGIRSGLAGNWHSENWVEELYPVSNSIPGQLRNAS